MFNLTEIKEGALYAISEDMEEISAQTISNLQQAAIQHKCTFMVVPKTCEIKESALWTIRVSSEQYRIGKVVGFLSREKAVSYIKEKFSEFKPVSEDCWELGSKLLYLEAVDLWT